MERPLYDALVNYSKEKLGFHMPGHKFGTAPGIDKLNLWTIDNTEALGMDNLYEAEGIIKEAMDLMASFYGADETIFLTNGSTSGILASILATCKEGDKLIIARNAHHSVWSALVLAGVIPIYVGPEYIEGDDILGEIKPEVIGETLKRYPEAKGVLIVSPTYEGIVSDIKSIANIVHAYDRILIVDEAHGAHFMLDEYFPTSAIKLGADIVINSMHKTLPALTQSGLLHIGSKRVEYKKLVECLRLIQTSSPSYMMMGLMDYIREYIISKSKEIRISYIEELEDARQKLSKLKRLRLIGNYIFDCERAQLDVNKDNTKKSNKSGIAIQDERLYNNHKFYNENKLYNSHQLYDRSKIIISTINANINGYKLADILNEKYKITVEAALDTYIILMTTMADNRETLGKLIDALMTIDSQLENINGQQPINDFINKEVTVGYNPRSIHYGDSVWCEIEACIGETASKNIMLYPPGIPIVCIGETITPKSIELIKRFKEKLQGIKLVEDKLYLYVVEVKEEVK